MLHSNEAAHSTQALTTFTSNLSNFGTPEFLPFFIIYNPVAEKSKRMPKPPLSMPT